jgi:hypothetical protein
MTVRVVYNRRGEADEMSDWMVESHAEALAEDLGGQGVYEAVRLEYRCA